MKRIHSILLFIVFVFFSCETPRYFSIEVQQPADVTFPVSSPKVVVVNNAVVQPENTGVIYKIGKNVMPPYALPKDTAHWACINYLGEELQKTGYFKDVLVYNYSLRNDDNFLQIEEIDPEKVEEIADGAQADALISVDKLLFKLTQTLLGDDYVHCSAQIEYIINYSVYIPGKEKPMMSSVLSDTLRYNDYMENDSAFVLKELPEALLMQTAWNISHEAALHFAPHWISSERLIYTGMSAQMKTAYAFATKNKWEEAGNVWKKLYESGKSKKQKGMIAINIAVSEEMQDRYSSALEWIKKARECYAQEKTPNVKEESAYADRYQIILEKRDQQNTLLDNQIKIQ